MRARVAGAVAVPVLVAAVLSTLVAFGGRETSKPTTDDEHGARPTTDYIKGRVTGVKRSGGRGVGHRRDKTASARRTERSW